MSVIRSFQDLEVWKKSVDLAVSVYGLTSAMPDDEKFGLSSQIRRASVSVAANIAEGAERDGPREYSRFLGIARGSLAEIETHLLLALRLGIAKSDSVEPILNQASEIGRMLNGLQRSLRAKY